jgi:hypothetical protein
MVRVRDSDFGKSTLTLSEEGSLRLLLLLGTSGTVTAPWLAAAFKLIVASTQ